MLDSISIALKIALEYVVILWWLMVKDVMMEILEMEMVAIVNARCKQIIIVIMLIFQAPALLLPILRPS